MYLLFRYIKNLKCIWCILWTKYIRLSMYLKNKFYLVSRTRACILVGHMSYASVRTRSFNNRDSFTILHIISSLSILVLFNEHIMILPIQCRITRKKRTMGRRKPKSFFKNLPIDLQSKIFDKLCVKDQSRAMCVSKSWRDCILYTTLPKEVPQQLLVNLHQTPFLDLNLQQLLNWCSRVMRSMLRATHIVDTSHMQWVSFILQ
jgi:hypothetical protein